MFQDSPPIRTDIEPSLHPDVLGREAAALDIENTIGRHALTDARSAMAVAYNSIGDLNDALKAVRSATNAGGRRMVKGTVTQHFPPSEELVNAAQRAFYRASRQIDASTASLNNHVRALESRVAAAVDDTTARTPLAAEVRHHVKTLKENRIGFVMKLISEGDKGSVASILGAPSYLSGLGDKDIGACANTPPGLGHPSTRSSSRRRRPSATGWSSRAGRSGSGSRRSSTPATPRP